MMAGKRYSYHLTGSEISQELWDCPFTRALCHITFLHRRSFGAPIVRKRYERFVSKVPIVEILLMNPQIHSYKAPPALLHLGTSYNWFALSILAAQVNT